jgi:hypothetical protein
MAQVITERPRAGGRIKTQKGERKRRQGDLEALPFRESTSRRRKPNNKSLTDVLGPLRRFLEKNIGRPWDKVYSELREHVHPRKQVEIHILDHVRWFVEKDVILVDGVPHRRQASRWWPGALMAPFYVHPATGLLTRNRRRPRKSRRTVPQPESIRVDDTHEIRQLDGLLFEVALAPVPRHRMVDEEGFCAVRDVVTGGGGTAGWFRDRYGGLLYAVRKRQLGKRELRKWRPEAERVGLVDSG